MIINKNFYPTPENIIEKMWAKSKNRYKRILEPSAGSGNIVEFIKRRNVHAQIYCIEKEPELRAVLHSKGYKIIHDDFLNYDNDIDFDLIIMNPPFDNGAKHFLKAWDIASNTDIICLLNEETVLNTYTKERELLLKIIQDNNGEIEYLGSCFKDSERKTDVKVALVTIKKRESNKQYSFKPEFKQFSKISFFENIDLSNTLAVQDKFYDLELRFNKVKELFNNLLKTLQELEYYGNNVLADDKSLGIKYILSKMLDKDYSELFSCFNEEIKKRAWKHLISKTNIADVSTSKVKDDIVKFIDQQSNVAFNKENMLLLLDTLFANKENIAQSSIDEAFETMTRYYPENRIHIEGWKTNDAWKVNRKVILPYATDFSFNGKISIYYTMKRKLEDIEKGLCFIAGKNINNINSITNVVTEYSQVWYDSEFFKFKLFKKGTIHLEFKDVYIWEQFNIQACKFKNWLPNK